MKRFIRRVYFMLLRTKYYSKKLKLKNYQIKNILETIETINNNDVSVARFGDGEIKWILKKNIGSFQDNSDVLSDRLDEVLKSNDENLLICLPDAFIETSQLIPPAKRFWRIMIVKYSDDVMQRLNPQQQYYNANISRNYIDYKDKKISSLYFKKIKEIWYKKDILLVEGEQTRMGVGNDLFSKANSVSRVLCPAKNAFSEYDKILKEVKSLSKIKKDILILISLGPTATILAYDLAKLGIRAIDIGQVDIEYEWALTGTQRKTAIVGKYVNEVENGKDDIVDINNQLYQNEIICKVGVK